MKRRRFLRRRLRGDFIGFMLEVDLLHKLSYRLCEGDWNFWDLLGSLRFKPADAALLRRIDVFE